MYVKIGKYPNWLGPYQIAEKLFFWLGEQRADRIGEWLAGKDSETWFYKLCLWYHKKFKNNGNQRTRVVIDKYDTWGMYNTLAVIVLPMLKQLKATKRGSPFCDQDDLPESMRLTQREIAIINGETLDSTPEERTAVDNKFFAQFDWILDQMIWSFEQIVNEDECTCYYDPYDADEKVEGDDLLSAKQRREMGKFNKEKYRIYQERKQLGFTLFGKYYQNLWT